MVSAVANAVVGCRNARHTEKRRHGQYTSIYDALPIYKPISAWLGLPPWPRMSATATRFVNIMETIRDKQTPLVEISRCHAVYCSFVATSPKKHN